MADISDLTFIGVFHVASEVFTPVNMNNTALWDVAPFDSCKNRCFGASYKESASEEHAANQLPALFVVRGFFLP
jgi:hypothetical protein